MTSTEAQMTTEFPLMPSPVQVREALNGGPGGGQYLPVSAIQNFDAAVSLRMGCRVYGSFLTYRYHGEVSLVSLFVL